jgi:hypothetical protein
MSTEEQRLARLLKNVVPEPPVQLSAEEITAPVVGSSARSWTPPALAAAAVVAIGVTVGLVATHASGPDRATAPLAGSSTSGSPSPLASATCPGRTATVPNVVGESMNGAEAIIQDVGLTVGVYFGVPAHVPPGTVVAQSPTAGSRAVPGVKVELEIASAPSTSTAAPVDPATAPTATSPCQAAAGTPPAANATQRVPNVVGMVANQAMWDVHAAGFTATKVITAPPASRPVPPGTVFAQTPAAGSSARPESGMTLYVAPAS